MAEQRRVIPVVLPDACQYLSEDDWLTVHMYRIVDDVGGFEDFGIDTEH
ncbi:hypothetical protein [Streptomyces specialis]|nr:hypothetical protein [Streptomyces specialis]